MGVLKGWEFVMQNGFAVIFMLVHLLLFAGSLLNP